MQVLISFIIIFPPAAINFLFLLCESYCPILKQVQQSSEKNAGISTLSKKYIDEKKQVTVIK